ncbi:MAG: tRNA G18 (ribose-2'-O)-methylase SpoU [Neolewinella sp.]|jgi:tRNA G18 (ribose-2'-O)-methylase SpoU
MVETLKAFRQSGALLLALELTDESVSLLDYRFPKEVITGQQEVILIPGAETDGVPSEILGLCHGSVHLPMYGNNTSMNVAVAVGAAVYLLLGQL